MQFQKRVLKAVCLGGRSTLRAASSAESIKGRLLPDDLITASGGHRAKARLGSAGHPLGNSPSLLSFPSWKCLNRANHNRSAALQFPARIDLQVFRSVRIPFEEIGLICLFFQFQQRHLLRNISPWALFDIWQIWLKKIRVNIPGCTPLPFLCRKYLDDNHLSTASY